jgi:hypothetical protein
MATASALSLHILDWHPNFDSLPLLLSRGKERRLTLSGLGRNRYSIGLEVRLALRDRLRRFGGMDPLASGETLLASTEAQWRQWFVHASPWSLADSIPLIFERGLVSSWLAIAVRESVWAMIHGNLRYHLTRSFVSLCLAKKLLSSLLLYSSRPSR